jgi:hypothetical protein
LERITLEAALYIDTGEASRSIDLIEETSKEPIVDKEVRESEEEVEEEIKELETLVEAET